MLQAINFSIIVLLSGLVILHLGVLLKAFPLSIVWGNSLHYGPRFYVMEGVSLVVSGVLLWTSLEHSGVVHGYLSEVISHIIMWAMTGLFFLSAIGNLLSKNNVEQRIFSIVAMVLAGLTLTSLLLSVS